MDIEEPKAALIISHTLRDERSKVAMETAHSEIMSTLISLCTPKLQKLQDDLIFQLVRNKMRGMFGAAVDNEDFLHFLHWYLMQGVLTACIYKTWSISLRLT